MLKISKHDVSQPQKLLVFVLSVSLTTFLIGGLVGYWVLSMLRPPVEQAASAASKGKRPSPQAQLVRVGEIEQQSMIPVRKLVGDLIPVRNAAISTEVAGKLLELPVDEGSKVIGGKTLLARIDDTWTTLEADKIAAQIAEKKATIAFERTDLKRYQELLARKAVSVSEATQKGSLVEELEASLRQLEVMLKESQERKLRLAIYAPFDGTVIAKNAEVGEYMAIGTQIVKIVSTGKIYAQAMVPEEILPLLNIGAPIEVWVDSLGIELKGTVSSINAQGSVGSRTFPVRVELDDQGGKLLPGMGVSVFVPVMRESTELLVPRDAVLMKPDESTIWVLQATDSSGATADPQSTWVAQPVPVRILSHTRDAYAIACERSVDEKLVAPGVHVVTEGLERLSPGAVVRIDTDKTHLAPLPGSYRSGQQIVERPESAAGR